MNVTPLRIGYMPLVDAAPLIVAQEIGFAGEEGLSLALDRAPSWSTLRDWLAIERIAAAHMLSPVPVAAALGLGGIASPIETLAVLSVNGNVVGVSRSLSHAMRAKGFGFDFGDPVAAGQALIQAVDGRLRIGVPFPFSMHAELLYYWLGALGLHAPDALDVHTVPPPLMAHAMARGEIDAFCVGEPWGSIAVEQSVGDLVLPGTAIWTSAPEKVLAVRSDWTSENGEIADRLIRALWRAGRWLDQPENRSTASEILSKQDYLNVSSEILDRALSGHLVVTSSGDQRSTSRFVGFHDGTVGFPWRSQAMWMAERLAARAGLDRRQAQSAGAEVHRSDIFRRALASMHVDLPSASMKIEGSLTHPTEVASVTGTLILPPDRFFDGKVFDPDANR